MPAPDPTTTVIGRMGTYPAVTIEQIDGHLAALRQRLARVEATNRFPDLPPKYRADMDKLLDRRAYLMMTNDREEAVK